MYSPLSWGHGNSGGEVGCEGGLDWLCRGQLCSEVAEGGIFKEVLELKECCPRVI